MTIIKYILIGLGFFFFVIYVYNKIKHGNKDWKTIVEDEIESEVLKNKDLSEDELIEKINFHGLKDNYPIYSILRGKGTENSLKQLIELYNKYELHNHLHLNKYHYLLTINEIAKRINYNLPIEIKKEIENNNPTT
jgi:hypothetical protein